MDKWFAKILLAFIVITSITGINVVQAATAADSFRNPLNNYAVTGYRFGEYQHSDDAFPGKYHAGEDLYATASTPVYAIANGYVKKAGSATGYGQVVVIEHTLPDGSKICSIYGHLSKTNLISSNTDVTKGKLIGYIGSSSENGGWPPHLHFGIKKGAYGTFEGYTSQSGLINFYKPSDYLNLIRAVNTNDVYRLSNLGKKAKIGSSDVFNSGGWRWMDIRPVTSSELNAHSTFNPNALYLPKGTFIKQSNSAEISIIREYSDAGGQVKNRYRQPFTSWNNFIAAGGKADLSNVRIVSSDEYNLYTIGK